jgi:AhpD family alkylhydroperoxidase
MGGILQHGSISTPSVFYHLVLHNTTESRLLFGMTKEDASYNSRIPPPKPYQQFKQNFPAVAEAYEQLGKACHWHGPLSPKERELIKIGIAIGAGMESATHAHVRLALEAGASPEEVRHAAVLATTTIGYPNMMRAMAWVNDVIDQD